MRPLSYGESTSPGLSRSDHNRSHQMRVRLTWTQLAAIFSYMDHFTPMPLTNMAISPAARWAVEWSRSGLQLSPRMRLLLRARTEDEGRCYIPSGFLHSSSAMLQHHVDVRETFMPDDLRLVQWWLQREPRLPLVLRASLLQGRVRMEAALCEDLCVVDVSSSSLLELATPSDTSLRSLHAINVSACDRLLFMPNLASATSLRYVNLAESAVMDITGLAAAVYLEEVDVTRCRHLSSLSGLAGLPYLRRVAASDSGVRDASALRGCAMLRELSLSGCAGLSDITALASCTALLRLDLSATAVRDLSSLVACKNLEELVISNCTGLLACPSLSVLVVLEAQGSGLTHLGGGYDDGNSTFRYPALERVVLNDCRQLSTLEGLMGSPTLRTLSATFSAVDSLAGLGACARLEEVDLGYCIFLRHLDGLAGAPSLRRVSVAFSGVRSVAALASCPCLDSLNVASCAELHDLAFLSCHPTLSTLNARQTPITSIPRQCSALRSIDVSGCAGVSDLSMLAADSPGLQQIDASNSGVRDASFLDGLRSLTSVRFDGCPLQDASFVASARARAVTVVAAAATAATAARAVTSPTAFARASMWDA